MRKHVIYILGGVVLFLGLVSACSVGKAIKDRYTPYRVLGKAGSMYRVEFTFDAPSAESVHLAGDFNNWVKPGTTVPTGETRNVPIPMQRSGKKGRWKVIWKLSPGRHLYKYIINRTTWRPDPQNPDKESDPYGGYNSVAHIR